MAISYYAEVTRETPAAKNKAGEKVRYNVRVFYQNDDVIEQMGGIGLVGNVGNYAKVGKYNVTDLSYGDIKTTTETGSYGTGAKFYLDVTAATSGTYKPGIVVEIYDPGIIGATKIGTSVVAALEADPSLLPVTFHIPAGQTVKIPVIQATKAPVTPDMPSDLKGRNNDGGQSGLDPKCLGFQYAPCFKSWMTIWKEHRYVNPKTNKIIKKGDADFTALNAGQGPKGYSKQFHYYIEAVTAKAYKDNPGKTLEYLRTNKIGVSRPFTAPGWDWAANNQPYLEPGTGICYASAKSTVEEKFKALIAKNCEEVPPVETGPSGITKSTVLPTAGNNSNPPPHIVTRHFSPIADYTKED